MIIGILKDFWVWRITVYLRYKKAISILGIKKHSDSILEVGSGTYGLRYFGFKNVISTDFVSHSGNHKLDITKDDVSMSSAFDYVLCLDVLEHINKKHIKTSVHNLLALTKNKLLISVPFGEVAYSFDNELYSYYISKNYVYKHLSEHISVGVFNFNYILSILSCHKDVSSIDIYNGINLKTYKKLIFFLFSKNKKMFYLKNKLIYPFRNVILKSSSDDLDPYRKFILVEVSRS